MRHKYKIYLRKIIPRETRGMSMDIFEGNIKKDKEFWNRFRNCDVRYFELKEAKK